MSDYYTKKCGWCNEVISVFESLTEFGKHYHHPCMIHKLNSEMETYKKKYLDGKMSAGDKTIFLDKFQLSQKLKNEEKPVFNGWKMIEERKTKSFPKKGKVMLVEPVTFAPILGQDGKPQYVDDNSTNEMSTAIMRPDITYTKPPERKSLSSGEARKQIKAADTDIIIAPKKLTLADVPRLMNSIG